MGERSSTSSELLLYSSTSQRKNQPITGDFSMVGITVSSVRVNGKEVPINTHEDLKKIYDLIGTCLQWGAEDLPETPHLHPAPPVSTNVRDVATPSYHPNFPPVGERSIDYAIRAADFLPLKFTLRQITDKMLAMGWKTKSEGIKARTNSVRATIRDRDDFINYHDGFWGYGPNISKHAPSPALISPLDDDDDEI
jgi:hypothetical protein